MLEAPTVEQLEEHLRVFGLAPGASLEEIKKRKAFLAKVMHEDVVSEKMKPQAREEMIRINLAWERINAWFKANPDKTETPKSEKKTADPGASSSPENEDDEDWEAWERRKKSQWKGEGITLEQLDLQRRKELSKKSRRGLVANCKIYVGLGLGAWFFLLCLAAAGGASFFLPQILCLGSIGVYLVCLFHPKAKAMLDEWVEKAE
jgi:hypothetical protein